MTRPRPLRRFDPFRPIDMLTSLWSAAAVAPVSGATVAYRTLFTTVRRLVVGRRLTVRLEEGDVTLTVTEFDSRLDARTLSVGQLDDVRLAARDVRYATGGFDHVTAVLHNVHVRPTATPVLVAAPVELTVEVSASEIDGVLQKVAPRWCATVGADSVARLRLTRRPSLGHLEVDASLDGSTLWLRPRGLVVGRYRSPLPSRTPSYPVHLPVLPRGLRLTGIEFGPDVVRLSGMLPEWRIEIPPTRLEDLIGALNVVGRPLNLTGFGRLR
ncbi:LmeA family phospholipid-binding protein [Mycolicibacterium sp. XJ662]